MSDTAPLPVEDAPAVESAVPAAWVRAESIYTSDFERAMDGAYPGRWRIHTMQWDATDDPSRFLIVRRTRSGGRVLHVQGPKGGNHSLGIHLQWGSKLVGGRLRLAFDVLRVGKADGNLSLSIDSLSQPADFGWPVPIEYGPYIRIGWPEGVASAIDFKWDETKLSETRLAPDKWHRIVLVADLDRKRYDLFARGRQIGRGIQFA